VCEPPLERRPGQEVGKSDREHRHRNRCGHCKGQEGHGGFCASSHRSHQQNPSPGRPTNSVHQADPKGGKRSAAERVSVRMQVVGLRLCPMAVGMQMGMGMPNGAMDMGMMVKLSAPPPNQQPGREDDDDQPNGSLGQLVHRRREITAEQYQRQAEGKQSSRVAGPPRKPQDSGSAQAGFWLVQKQRGDRREMVGVGRVTEPEQQGHHQWHQHGGSIPLARSKITDTLANGRIDSRP
jgi:hypothetical protein